MGFIVIKMGEDGGGFDGYFNEFFDNFDKFFDDWSF